MDTNHVPPAENRHSSKDNCQACHLDTLDPHETIEDGKGTRPDAYRHALQPPRKYCARVVEPVDCRRETNSLRVSKTESCLGRDSSSKREWAGEFSQTPAPYSHRALV